MSSTVVVRGFTQVFSVPQSLLIRIGHPKYYDQTILMYNLAKLKCIHV